MDNPTLCVEKARPEPFSRQLSKDFNDNGMLELTELVDSN
jgi:hypothetical protein